MILNQLLNLTKMPRAYIFHMHKAIYVVVVYENKDLMLTIFSIIGSSLNSFNGCQQFTIVGFISSFY